MRKLVIVVFLGAVALAWVAPVAPYGAIAWLAKWAGRCVVVSDELFLNSDFSPSAFSLVPIKSISISACYKESAETRAI